MHYPSMNGGVGGYIHSEITSMAFIDNAFAYSGNVSLAESKGANLTNQTASGVNGSIVTLPPFAQLELEDRRH